MNPASPAQQSPYSKRVIGDPKEASYRLFIQKDGVDISPFHDIPLAVSGKSDVFNMIVEIPKGSTAKLEINKGEDWNPIKQDIKDGKLRHVEYRNGYPWHYGAFPQTWEDPNHIHPDTRAKGDNDPLDVIDVSSLESASGDIVEVKVLGALALIDEGETDWKIVAINVNDPLAAQVHDVEDIAKIEERKSYLDDTHSWFRDYKTVVGKPQNVFAYDGKYKGKQFAVEIVNQHHELWKKLVAGQLPKGIWFKNATEKLVEEGSVLPHTEEKKN